jgi:hypothetical protein
VFGGQWGFDSNAYCVNYTGRPVASIDKTRGGKIFLPRDQKRLQLSDRGLEALATKNSVVRNC